MEPYAAGWLSILPPIIAIVLALITKEVFSSLLIGIFSGAAIYTFGSGVQKYPPTSWLQNGKPDRPRDRPPRRE